MKRVIILCISALILALCGTALLALDSSGQYLVRLPFDDSADFKAALLEFNAVRHYDIAGIDRDKMSIDLVVSEPEFRLISSEYEMEIMIHPGDPAGRVDPLYTDEAELVPILQQYHADYPAITDLITIGQTEEGLDIYAIKISDNADQDEDEPVILFNGQHHAREVMCVEVCLDTIDQLVTLYGTDPTVTAWVDDLEIWVVPIVNMDGVAHVFDVYDMWRKDRHPNAGGSYGIDPNRNYPAFWNTCNGSSGDPSMDTYRGENPGDSYCVSHMMTFSSQIKPWMDLSYHSYSELVLYPYGCDGAYSPEHEIVENIGQTMAGLIERDNGTMGYTPGTPWDLLYSVDGGDIDWHYAENGTLPFVVELNASAQGFLPSYNPWRDSTVARMRPGWGYLLDRFNGPLVTGHIMDACSGAPVNATYELQEFPMTTDETPRTTDTNGRYFKFVNSGEYHIEVSALGYADVTIPVTVGTSQFNMDIPLIPDGSYGLYIVDHVILDGSGDNDGVIDPGETVAIEVHLQSVGNTTAVSADLLTSDPYITVDTGHAVFGNIADGATGSSQSPHFVVTVDAMCPTEHVVEFNLSITANETLCVDSGVIIEKVSNYIYECPIYEEMLDTNPGYAIDNTGSGGWEFGAPSGGPGSGHTGANCYATNLDGDHGDNGNFNLTSTAFDCSAISDTELRFWRWLQNESGYDTAYVQISTDNSTWVNVWGGYAYDSVWTEQTIDISDYADGQPQVFLRWKLTSDTNTTELGFYIDDITICGYTLPPNVPRLQHDSHIIDDSAGNGNGEINAGESIVMPVILINTGTDATGISGTLSTLNPHVSITTNTASWPDINQNYTGTSLTGFEFTVSPEAYDGETILFTIDWFTNEFSGNTSFMEMIVAPTLEFSSATVIDPSRGDADGILDPGESAQIMVTLMNTGTGMAQTVSAILSSNHPEYITLNDDEALYPNISSGSYGSCLSPYYSVTVDPMTPNHTMIIFTLDITAEGYSATDTFQLEVTTSNFAQRYAWPLDSDPGWTTEGDWNHGVPLGNDDDPSSGYTGANVYGYNLAGDYTNSLPETHLTSTAIDCSNLMNVEVRFMRWLGVESSTYDHASFEVSSNGTTWTTIWDHSGSSFTDPDWQPMVYDISAVADEQATVYLRWVMGSTDSTVVYCGWNVDDIEIWAESSSVPTPTPTPECLNHGDVTLDGEVTAGDAQLCFQIAMGAYTPSDTEACAADCNADGEVTAGDAQGVFITAMGAGTCSDTLPPVKSAFSELSERTGIIATVGNDQIWIETAIDGDLMLADIMVDTMDSDVDAFTCTIQWNSDLLVLDGCREGSLSADWVQFGCNTTTPGNAVLAGFSAGRYAEDFISAGSYGSIGQLVFRFENADDLMKSNPGISLTGIRDDLAHFRILK